VSITFKMIIAKSINLKITVSCDFMKL